jgi:uncharacterized membrane protein
MNTKLILLTLVVTIIFYIIRFHFFHFSESRKVTMNVVSNSEQNIRHNYEKYGILGLIGMIGIILFILINFFERPFYLTKVISDIFKPTLK